MGKRSYADRAPTIINQACNLNKWIKGLLWVTSSIVLCSRSPVPVMHRPSDKLQLLPHICHRSSTWEELRLQLSLNHWTMSILSR